METKGDGGGHGAWEFSGLFSFSPGQVRSGLAWGFYIYELCSPSGLAGTERGAAAIWTSWIGRRAGKWKRGEGVVSMYTYHTMDGGKISLEIRYI